MWQPLTSDESLAGHAAVMTRDHRMVVHGGEQDVNQPPGAMRQLDLNGSGAAWSTFPARGVPPASRLPGRGLPGSRAVIDAAEDVMLTVCDCAEGHTFLLDVASGNWTRAPRDADLPLWYSVLVYDAPRDRAVLYGGQVYGLGDQVAAALATYDLSAARGGWRTLPDAPIAWVYQAAGVEPRSGHLVLFGGQDENGVPQAALWRLDLAQVGEAGAWVDITRLAGPGPTARLGATLVFDPETGHGVLYGGYTAEGDLDDAWLLDYADPATPRWTRLAISGAAPGPRSGHSAVWDASKGRMVIYGGARQDVAAGARFLGDTWALTLEPEQAQPTPIYMPVGYSNETIEGR